MEIERKLNIIFNKVGLLFEFRQEDLFKKLNVEKRFDSEKDGGYFEAKFSLMEDVLVYAGTTFLKDVELFGKKMNLSDRELALCKKFEENFLIRPYNNEKRKEMGYMEIPIVFGQFYVTNIKRFLEKEKNKKFVEEFFPAYDIKKLFNETEADGWLLMEINKEKRDIAQKISQTKAMVEIKKTLNQLFDDVLLKR